MSAGSHPTKRTGGGVQRTPWAAGKPRRTGLPFIPRVVYRELVALCAEEGSEGLLVVFVTLRRRGSEVAALRQDPVDPGTFAPKGDPARAVTLPPAEAAALAEGLGWLAAKKLDGPKLTRHLYGLGRRLQGRLASHYPWAEHVRVGVTLLHRLGDELAVEELGPRHDELRAYAGSRYATPESLRPVPTEGDVTHLDAAMASFYAEVAGRIEESS